MKTFNEIDFSFRGFDALQAQPAVVQSETPLQQMFTWYRVVRPWLLAITATLWFSPSWRGGLSAFIAAADLAANLNPPPTAPAAVAEAASSDPTTTDPIGTDPSFKAGKDL